MKAYMLEGGRDRPWIFTEDRALPKVLKVIQDEGVPDGTYQVKEVEEIWIDGGGAVLKDEPKTWVEVEGIKCSTFTGQLPFILEALRAAKLRPWGCVVISGIYGTRYAFSPEFRTALVSKLEAEQKKDPGAAARIQQQHMDAIHRLQEGSAYLGACHCQSGKPYVECHGRKS